MVNIYTDTDKLKIICDFKNHSNFPYGTTVLTFEINGLTMDATNDLILFNNQIGGFVFASFISDLKFNGVQATKVNVNRLFQETCFSCCSSGGGGGGGTVDTKDIVDALDRINETLKKEYPPTPSGDCCDKLWFEEYVKKEEPIEQDNNTKYMIYEEDEDCCDLFWTEDYMKSEEFAELYPDEKTKYMIYIEDEEPTPIFPSYSSKTETNTDCEGYDLYRYTYIITYVSYNNGETWEEYKKVLSSKELIESECPICGHLPEPIYSSTTRTYEGCEGYDYYKYTEIKYYSGYSSTDLVQYGMNTNKELIEKNSSHCGFNPEPIPTGTILYHNNGEITIIQPYFETNTSSKYYNKWLYSNQLHETFTKSSTSITVDNRVQVLNVDKYGDGVFLGYRNLVSVKLPDGLEIIGEAAFYNCTSLSSLMIPNNVKIIEKFAFFDCTNLITLNYNGTMSQWNAITKNEDWNAFSKIEKVICTDGEITIK